MLSIKCIVRVLLHRCIKKKTIGKKTVLCRQRYTYLYRYPWFYRYTINSIYSVCIPTLFLHEHVHIIYIIFIYKKKKMKNSAVEINIILCLSIAMLNANMVVICEFF